MKVTMLQCTPEPLQLIAKAASVCYDKEASDPEKLVKMLYRNGHHSVFEHVWFTFKVDGISRACSHQLVRHRKCSFTQRSQRYCEEDGFGFVEPHFEDEAQMALFRGEMDQICDVYDSLMNLSVKAEDARMVLPNACETVVVFSCDLRELMHMANERMCRRAQWEIREMMQIIKELVPEELRGFLVPRCQCPTLRCNEDCEGVIV